MVKNNGACATCHTGKEKAMGEKIVKGGPLEPMPVKGKNGYVDLKFQAAYDAKNAYLRFQWKTLNPFPGTEHQYLRFDGKEWKVYGYPKLDKVVQDGKQPGIYEDRMTIMIDDGKVPGFATAGLLADLPRRPARHAEAVHQGRSRRQSRCSPRIKKNDVRKYLPASRNDPSDWKTGKSVEEIEQDQGRGRLRRPDPVARAPFAPGRHGRRRLRARVAQFRLGLEHVRRQRGRQDACAAGSCGTRRRSATSRSPPTSCARATISWMREKNAVPFDPNAGWKEGDMIPDYFLSREDAKGSAADNNAIASWKDGVWTVVMIRPLGLANDDDKSLKEGGVYNIGFAMHDDNITTRGHQVSFVRTIGFGAKANIEAVKLP